VKADRVDGSLLRLGEGHEIAIYHRHGVPYVAEFRGGRGELHTVGTWFALHHRGTALRRAGVEPVAITPEVAGRIERLHCRPTRSAWVARYSDAVLRLLGVRRVDKGECSCRSFASPS
jgi:hypothetical protein